MSTAPWSLHVLSEVLSAFTVDSPTALADVIHRVAEAVDAEIVAIVRDAALTLCTGLIPDEYPRLLTLVASRGPSLQLGDRHYHLFWVPLGPQDLLVVGRSAELFDLEERALLRAMGRSVQLSLQVLAAVQAEKQALRAEQLAKEEAIREATLDHLMGLPNRRMLLRCLQERLASPPQSGVVALLFIDLDGFKKINDLHGHRAGDQVLKAVGTQLRQLVRRQDLVGRISGDEFLMISQVRDPVAAQLLARRILERLQQPMLFRGVRFVVTASIGIAVGEAGQASETLLENADMAMYAAKQKGAGRVVVYEAGMRMRLEEQNGLQQELRLALARGEIKAWLQPILSAAHGGVVGFEALARWQHPQRGLLTPNVFVPAAEEARLLPELDAAVMRDACTQIGSWPCSLEGLAPRLSVNVSALSLADPELESRIRASLAQSGFPGDRLFLEITETTLVEDVASAYANIAAAEHLGIRLAIDDFGTGYSSLSYLRRFPVGILKIDRSFVDGLGREAEDEIIIDTVIRMASSLGLEVVAEGVETPQQAEMLKALGCHCFQGYLYGRPADPQTSRERYECSLNSQLRVDLLEA
jgi:diguanylate cyclase (GGDEF)-like protein